LSGEIRAESTWEPSDPAAPAPDVTEEKGPPKTWAGAILAGIVRAILILALLAGIAVLIALLFVWLANSDPARAFPRSFILVGGLIALGGLGTMGGPAHSMFAIPVSRDERAINMSFVSGFFGIVLIVIGFALDSML
jgi:hypothetical protein